MGTSPIMPCYDVERLEPKTHIGLDPGESVEYTNSRVVFSESTLRLEDFNGSNRGPFKALSTVVKSQGGTVRGRGGFILLAPCKNVIICPPSSQR